MTKKEETDGGGKEEIHKESRKETLLVCVVNKKQKDCP